jgi:hypothetical protein
MPSVYRNKVKVAGTWRSVNATYVKVNGTWKAATGVYTKVDGSWKTSYPFPLSADVGIDALYIDGLPMDLNRLYNPYIVSYTTTSVTLSVTKSDANATVTGTGVKSVAYNTTPNPYTITVTAEDGVTTKDYVIYIKVADPGKSVTIYYAFCVDGISQASSYTSTTTDSGFTACGEMNAALGYPKKFTCTSVRGTVTLPICQTCPDKGCCQSDPNTPEYCTSTGLYAPQYDPCCGTTCPTLFYPGTC